MPHPRTTPIPTRSPGMSTSRAEPATPSSPTPSRKAKRVPHRASRLRPEAAEQGDVMAKDHGSSVKDDKQYEGLRKKGMSKSRAARIANSSDASSKGGKASGSGKRRDTS